MITAKILFFLLITALGHSLGRAPSEATDLLNNDPHGHLLEVGRAPKLTNVSHAPAEVKVVSYNIRYRYGKDLKELARLFKEDRDIGGAAILGLQEVDRNRKRTGNQNTAKALADELGMYYAWAAPPVTKAEKEEETGVAILSSYPLSDVRRIVLPHEGPGKKRRVGLGATVNIGAQRLRVYSVHAETRMSLRKKLEQSGAALTDLAKYDAEMPAIVLGDFNTWEDDVAAETIKLFTGKGFHTPFKDDHTFRRVTVFVPIKFRLDWIWLRNLQPAANGIRKEIELSDHWPLWINLNLKPTESSYETVSSSQSR